jgi:hypothetical protein
VGRAIGSAFSGPAPSAGTLAAAKSAIEAGYVIPPNQVNPSALNRMVEGMAGKISTAQNASARNSTVTTQKAATALGLAPDTELSKPLLEGIRSKAGQAYEVVKQTGTVTPGKSYDDALDAIVEPFKKAVRDFPNVKPNPIIEEIDALRTQSFGADSAVELVKKLRNEAGQAYAKSDKQAGRAYNAAVKALEDALDDHMVSIGAPADILKNYRDARQLIAKTHTVEKALNPTTGTVNAGKLASDLARGKPLSGELRQAAEFAQAFPKAAQTPEKMGSLPQLSPLDWAMAGLTNTATLFARPAARAASLSGPVQRGLLGGPPSAELEALEGLLYRSAPLALGAR